LQKIGEKALKLVIKYEERQGRTVKKMPQGFGYDLESRKGRDVRKIEVKATTGKTLTEKRMYNLTLKEWKVFSEKNNAWIYIVYSVRDNPQLIRIQRNHIRLDQVKVIAPQINLRFRKEQAEQLMVNAEDLSHFEE
jgi:hypothetical protein